ncbi:MAG: hypothetical protein KGQ59_10405 [Bdellovibrionales bacterium]|nr:hypothetical protein [Bdellovibrionales bacterium]
MNTRVHKNSFSQLYLLLLPLVALSWGSTTRAEELIALPKMTQRTNSEACINKFRDLHSLASTYFSSLPDVSGIRRLDFLVGGLSTDSGFAATQLGKQYGTEYYSAVSNYATPDSMVVGRQQVLFDLYEPKNATIESVLTLTRNDGARIALASVHSSCEAREKAKKLFMKIVKGSNDEAPSPSAPRCSFEVSLKDLSGTSLCTTESATNFGELAANRRNMVNAQKLEATYTTFNGLPAISGVVNYSDVDTPMKLDSKLSELISKGVYYVTLDPTISASAAPCETGYPQYPSATEQQLPGASLKYDLERLRYAGLNKAASLAFLDSLSIKTVPLSAACERVKP